MKSPRRPITPRELTSASPVPQESNQLPAQVNPKRWFGKNLSTHPTHINRKFPTKPLQLRRVCNQSADTAHMGFLDVNRIRTQSVDDQEILREHVRVLIIFGGYVLAQGVGEGDGMGPSKGNFEYAPGSMSAPLV